MRNVRFILSGLVLILFFSGCKKKSDLSNLQNQWSGLNPTSIPVGIRVKELEKGNLVSNPSFELGRYYMVDSTQLSFNLPGWRRLGKNVVWTNTENLGKFDPDEASSGIHAIKIDKVISHETEVQGEGIITDYIKVIPGNYQLSMDIKLSHIRSNQQRLGSGIFDAVNIRIYCYDRNKVMIRNEQIHPLYNKKIDNSFKGFGFSNFSEIKDFDWGRIYGRSANFPFEEGNFPENTRYVRIFAGLKGEGTLWVDHMDFRYTEKNFTLLEQIQPYFDSTLEKSILLLPSPQKIEFYKKLTITRPGKTQKEQIYPVLYIPNNADAFTRKSIVSFRNKLPYNGKGGTNLFGLTGRYNPKQLHNNTLIFCFGNNKLSAQFANQLPFDVIESKAQSYFIKRLSQIENVVFIGYSDPEGLRHALHTLEQLMDFPENTYHHYDILDFPDYQFRSLIADAPDDGMNTAAFKNKFKLLSSIGLNTWIFESKGNHAESTDILQDVKEWADFNPSVYNLPYLRKGISLENISLHGVSFNRKENGRKKTESEVKSSSQKLHQKLLKLSEGKIDLMIYSDHPLWEKMTMSTNGTMNMDMNSFTDFLYYRDLFLNNLNQKGRKKLPSLYFIPSFLDKSGLSDVYRELYSTSLLSGSVNERVSRIIWPGPAKNASLVDAVDRYRFSDWQAVSFIDYSLTYKTETSYYGDFYNLYPGKALSGVIFKPFDTRITGIDADDLNHEFFVKVHDLSPVRQIRIITAIDYLWNNSAYNPALSLWKSLNYIYGKEIARELILFNDLYYKILSVSLDLDLNGYNQKIDNQGEELIVQLNDHWQILKNSLAGDIIFLNELSDMKNNIISRFYQSQQYNPPGRN